MIVSLGEAGRQGGKEIEKAWYFLIFFTERVRGGICLSRDTYHSCRVGALGIGLI